MGMYELLSRAIIVQAAHDYRKAWKYLKMCPGDEIKQAEIDEIERFFLSQWFGTLTDVDGAGLLRKLKQEVLA